MDRLIYKLFLVLFCLIKCISPINYDVIEQRLECSASPKDLCVNPNCSTRPVKRDLTYIDFNCTLHERFNNITIQVTLYYKFSEFRKFLVDVEENLCDYFKNNKSTKVINIAMPLIIASSNMKKCPLKDMILVKDMNINSVRNPPGIPSGQYRLDFSINSNNRPLTTLKVYFTAKTRGAAKNEMG